ncbi:hypothetical protein TBLA_0B04570 [Henningerozyma blattae CBS 6284]|uniref:Mitochondrial carrier protein RIM2 n=1 Tax=Henningerozyma blattae (strain ATCC 34711 / CBS 6284 / DSM 70876 / NBRC 10599 / NRRL Y-10934 / UCD 77-7) TaxID=1071380 RepID=I2GYU1_HENB6|nr:hypothetical protein TBLA_0B04570 [Tetrapisispora blattae CBS 6284]CCH59293.1 hypothetical protein TBLA_0B04570 [Tetrapisispora blattae CBS 6284]
MPRKLIEELEDLEEQAIESAPYLASDERGSNYRESIDLVQKELAVPTNTNVAEISKPIKLDQQNVKPWVHFVAGGLGGMTGAIATCPFDLIKTRLQSDEYRTIYKSKATTTLPRSNFKLINLSVNAGVHFKETLGIIGKIYQQEGFRSLFKGLGPNLVGVIPARSINFFTYGTTKELYTRIYGNGKESPLIHFMAAATAGWATATATNPIWLIKTRLQLDKFGNSRKYTNSWDCTKKVVRSEGILSLYKGLSASYLGSVEGILQWLLYEQFKKVISQRSSQKFGAEENTRSNKIKEWCQRSGGAGLAKFVASIITYPHEVVRTRLRQAPMENGKLKYSGLIQSFKVIIKEEGFASMYSGLTPHLMRTVPNSIIMFGTWELFIKLLS